ncbi:hypothetical protein MFLO_15294 [Listeria floridensis FSL S10-1187]|uniref:Na+/glutamate symporter n=1 Tax=Listeria floridensis FSL S10-1187 TaxID=1265817 RepID=A0ABN0RBP0_9LIST|nr:hypothetical protein [Listeria floridensis]EUJ25612.1 hypothetical protein MFLO_15294 [Listeria floridensis FSL S10-1187]
MATIGAFLAVMIAIFVGEWVSTRTRAFIPSLFITSVIFIIGYWTIFPKDLVEKASFGINFASICVPLLLVHLGTSMNLKQLARQWKAVLISLLGVSGTLLLTLTIGSLVFDLRTVLAAVPALVGGIVSALLMSDSLTQLGLTSLATLPVYMIMFHGILGYPITSLMLRKEARRLQTNFQAGTVSEAELQEVKEETVSQKFIEKLPADYKTGAFILARVILVAILAFGLSKLMNDFVNFNILCLLFGVVFSELGFLEKDVLHKAGVFNWLLYGLIAYIFMHLSTSTPQGFLSYIPEIIILLVIGVIGMYIVSVLISRYLKLSKEMGFAIALTALLGFPADYILTNDVIKDVAKTEPEQRYLTQNMLPPMLVGGFTTVSIASVVIASIFIKFL